MTRTFIYTAAFRHCWRAMGLSEEQLRSLELLLLQNPQRGDVIEGTGRGKRGGGRVIYLDVFENESLYLLFAYPKNVQADLSPDQKKAIRTMIEAIRKE